MPVITWNEPGTSDDVEYVEIYRSTTETGTYTLVDTISAKDGDGDWVVTYDDSAGTNTDWYELRFMNSASVTGLYSLPRQVGYSNITYTTIQIVRDEVKDMSTSITDTMIRNFIVSAECQVDMIMRDSFKTTFDSSKHGPIRRLTTKLSALDCLKYDIANTVGTAAGAAMIDSLNNDIAQLKIELSIKRNVLYLKSL